MHKERNNALNAILFCKDSTDYTEYLECWSVIATRSLSAAFSTRFEDALECGAQHVL
jgi:hypothetical protein